LSQLLQFQLFESDPIRPSYEITNTLSSQQVDESLPSGGQFTWPFAIALPPILSSSAGPSTARHRSDSSFGHPAPRSHSTGLRGQLIVTIYRRGRLTRNVGYVLSVPLFTSVPFHSKFGFRLTQQIQFVPPPEPVLTASPSLLSTELPSSNSGESRGLPADSPWPHQDTPRVIVRGVIFRRLQVDIECKVSLKCRIWLSRLTLVLLSAYYTCKQGAPYAYFGAPLIFDHHRFHTLQATLSRSASS
jgi:hypothetical protein